MPYDTSKLWSLLGPFESEYWKKVNVLLADLISKDSSLRGDLAHLSLFFFQRNSLHSKETGSPTAAAKAYVSFCGDLKKYTEGNSESSSAADEQNFGRFCQRKNKDLGNKLKYTNLVFLHVFAGLEFKENYTKNYVHAEVGELSSLILEILNRLSSENTKNKWPQILQACENFKEGRTARKTGRSDIDGLLENGVFTPADLWTSIFHSTPKSWHEVSGTKSEEKYYACYRMSSISGRPRVVKSFLVIQSPGLSRKYFCFKNFYRVRDGIVRRSAGAIVPLGDTIAMFGSSQIIGDDVLDKRTLSESTNHSGPKSLFFDSNFFKIGEMAVPGILVSTSNDGSIIAANTVLLETHLNHSSLIGIGTFLPDALSDDVEKLTEKADLDKGKVFEYLIESISKKVDDSILKCYMKGSFSTRQFF